MHQGLVRGLNARQFASRKRSGIKASRWEPGDVSVETQGRTCEGGIAARDDRRTVPRPFYHREGITIYHADCRDVLPCLPAESVDFVLTDPPYLVSHAGRWDRKHEPITGDDDPSWVAPVFAELYRVLRRDSLCVSFYGWPHADLFVSAFKAAGFCPVSHLAFVKTTWGLGRFTRGRHETGFLLAKGSPVLPEKAISDVIEWEREQEGWHPHQKPLMALLPLIIAYAPEGGLVLDPFMGSGSTLRAAKDTGCRGIGIEVEHDYCGRAAERMAQGVLFPARRAPREEETATLFGEGTGRTNEGS